MTPAPDRYAVIGHPIAHSRSPWIHAQFAKQTGEHVSYAAIDLAPAELTPRLRDFFVQGGRGLNVTVPHKQAVLPLLDELSERARIAGAVNTVIRQPDARLRGDNTDGSGFIRDLTHNLGFSVSARRVLLLGAGGATRGLLAPLLALEPAELVIANRSPERAAELAQRFASRGAVRGCGYEALGSQRFELIINGTAASLDQQLPPLPLAVLEAATICYDLAYAAGGTRFVRWAREHGVARCVDGTGMLVEQAADSFMLWRGVRPDTAPVLATLAA
ncbi:MAG TPA: shikimate dehydrogenase [Steroidobacteraceae bacterium]|jgi:shikimate dehydrogenase|nr:shikimate dehydrogenase [Steroidobacteraceae bacterium]